MAKSKNGPLNRRRFLKGAAVGAAALVNLPAAAGEPQARDAARGGAALPSAGALAAETGGAATLFVATFLGVPVSTTHTITGAVVGVGAARRVSAVRWNVASSIVYAWVITIPAAAGIAALAYWAVPLLR